MGLKPGEFWSLTPYETVVYVQAQSQQRIVDAYASACLTNPMKRPSLEEILKPKAEEKADTSAALSAMFIGLAQGNVTVKQKVSQS
jgi:hypothetical protein